MIVADTDVLIDFLAGQNPGALRVASGVEQRWLRTTAVSRFELLCGARTTRQETLIRRLLDALPTLPLNEEAADRASQVRRALERTGDSIGMGDSLIAGTVMAHGGMLLTRNRRHFERVKGLQLAPL